MYLHVRLWGVHLAVVSVRPTHCLSFARQTAPSPHKQAHNMCMCDVRMILWYDYNIIWFSVCPSTKKPPPTPWHKQADKPSSTILFTGTEDILKFTFEGFLKDARFIVCVKGEYVSTFEGTLEYTLALNFHPSLDKGAQSYLCNVLKSTYAKLY